MDMSKKEIRSSLGVVVTVVVTLFSACGAFVPQSTLHGRLARQNCLDVANCRHARPSILTCSLSEDATRRALLKAVALWPLTLFTENAAAALGERSYVHINYTNVLLRLYVPVGDAVVPRC